VAPFEKRGGWGIDYWCYATKGGYKGMIRRMLATDPKHSAEPVLRFRPWAWSPQWERQALAWPFDRCFSAKQQPINWRRYCV